MGARLAVPTGVVGAAVAVIVFALPAEARLPVAAGGGAAAFGLYVLRARGRSAT